MKHTTQRSRRSATAAKALSVVAAASALAGTVGIQQAGADSYGSIDPAKADTLRAQGRPFNANDIDTSSTGTRPTTASPKVANPGSAAWSATLTSNKNGPCRNSTVTARFDDSISYGWTTAQASGTSRASWLGSNPTNAKTMKLNDKFQYHGVSVSISYPAGGTISGGGGGIANWNTTRENVWTDTHQYNNLNGSGALTSWHRWTTGTWDFGDGSCMQQASGEKFLT